jgi:hypothetical protein
MKDADLHGEAAALAHKVGVDFVAKTDSIK